jgi:hypothetical protein
MLLLDQLIQQLLALGIADRLGSLSESATQNGDRLPAFSDVVAVPVELLLERGLAPVELDVDLADRG